MRSGKTDFSLSAISFPPFSNSFPPLKKLLQQDIMLFPQVNFVMTYKEIDCTLVSKHDLCPIHTTDGMFRSYRFPRWQNHLKGHITSSKIWFNIHTTGGIPPDSPYLVKCPCPLTTVRDFFMQPCETVVKHHIYLHSSYVARLHQNTTESQSCIYRGLHLQLP